MSEVRPNVRRSVLIRESTPQQGKNHTADSVVRAVGIVVVENPFLQEEGRDPNAFDHMGAMIGDLVMQDLVDMLPSPACAYGKATLVGQSGNPEHGAALMHPTLGKPIRAAIGGGEAIIPSNVKVGSAGATIDVPISHKDDVWSFDHLDTITVFLADAPKPDEIMVIVALSTGKRATV